MEGEEGDTEALQEHDYAVDGLQPARQAGRWTRDGRFGIGHRSEPPVAVFQWGEAVRRGGRDWIGPRSIQAPPSRLSSRVNCLTSSAFQSWITAANTCTPAFSSLARSDGRRVGKGCRSRR